MQLKKTSIKTNDGISRWRKCINKYKAKYLQKGQTNPLHSVTIYQRINKFLKEFILTTCGSLIRNKKSLRLILITNSNI